MARSSEQGSPAWVRVGTLLLLLDCVSVRGGKTASLGLHYSLHITLKSSFPSRKTTLAFLAFIPPSVFQ